MNRSLLGSLPLLVSLLTPTLVGCGEVTAPPDEAPEPEPPAAEPPVAALPVRVTALTDTGDGRPDQGATALFVGPDGALVAEVPVDADGKASATLPAGGTVHTLRVIARGNARTVSIQSVLGVAPGDELVLGRQRRVDDPTAITRALAGSFTSAGAGARHSFFTECGAAFADAPPLSLPVRADCPAKRLRLLATAVTASGELLFTTTDVDTTPGASFTVPATWQPMRNFSLVVERTPPELFGIGLNRFTLLGAGASPVAHGAGTLVSAPSPGTNVAAVPFPPAVGGRALLEAFLSSAAPASDQLLTARTADLATSATLDASELEVPWLLGKPTPSATGVSWRQRDAGAPDLRLWTWAGTFTAGGLVTTVRWSVADSGTSPAATLPGLPPQLAALDPLQQLPGAVTPLQATVQYVDHSEVAGYAQARRNAFELGASPRVTPLFADRAYRARSASRSSLEQ